MLRLDEFHDSKRVEIGSLFAVCEPGEEAFLAEILCIGTVERAGSVGRVHRMICLKSGLPVGSNEIELHDPLYISRMRKKDIPANRIVGSRTNSFCLDDIRWMLEGISENAEVYYLESFSWRLGWFMKDIEKHIRLEKGLTIVGELEAKFKRLLQDENV
jgi:hypothetical protein